MCMCWVKLDVSMSHRKLLEGWWSLQAQESPSMGQGFGKPDLLHKPSLLARPQCSPGWTVTSPLSQKFKVFAVCSCLLYLETEASQSHKLP